MNPNEFSIHDWQFKFNNSMIFSKKELSRFPNENEVENLIEYYESVT